MKKIRVNYRKLYIELLKEYMTRESTLQDQLAAIEHQVSVMKQISHNQLDQLWDKKSGKKLYK